MNFLKRLFGPPKTVITYAPNVSAPQPPAPPPPATPAPLPPPVASNDDEITLIDPVAKDVWSIGRPEMQQNFPWPKRKSEPKPDPEKK